MYRSLIPVMVPFHESETPVGPRLYVYSRKQHTVRNETISVQYANEYLPACIAVLFFGDVVAKISVERFGARQRRFE